jgi:hypothetical protein
MHSCYTKLCEFELNTVDKDIANLFTEVGPGYHGLPTQMQIARYLKELVLILKEKPPNTEKGSNDGDNSQKNG